MKVIHIDMHTSDPFSTILKKYREKNNKTQKEMAYILGISERMYVYYEKGDYDGSPSKIAKYIEKLSGNLHDKTASNGTKINLSNTPFMMVPLVGKYAYAGYLTGYGDDEYIDELPKIPFMVDKEYKGIYRAFEVKGDSMDNGLSGCYKEGYIVLAREVIKEHWRDKLHIRKWQNFVVVTRTEGILIKQISKHDAEKGMITLHSLNPDYKDIEMNLDNVAQLFNVIKFIGE